MQAYLIIESQKTIWLDKECNKLMQGVRIRMTACFFLTSPKALGDTPTSTMPFFHF